MWSIHRIALVGLGLCIVPLAGCGDSSSGGGAGGAGAGGGGAAAADSFLQIDADTTPDERRYLEAGKAFIVALAAGDYAAAYAELSSHAIARMSPNQFVPATDDAEYARREAKAHPNVSAELFPYLMKPVVDEYGPPRSVDTLYVHETDPLILAGKGDRLDVMFAIGAMPASVPADIRRASLRGRVHTQLTEAHIAALIKDTGMTRQEIQQDPDIQPYYNIKFVLVEEGGRLKVGYFEIMPPSVLD